MARDARATLGAVDSLDADGFVNRLTEDVVFRFGNADPIQGRAAVKEAVLGFWSSIDGLTHHIKNVWEVDADTSVANIDVEYRRKDGYTVFVPNVDILHWDGDLVDDWQILIDLAAVYAPFDQVPDAAKSLSAASA